MIDPLLSKRKDENRGLSINGLFLGAFGYADDIRTISTDMKDQFNSVNTYINSRGLNLCIEKCGTVVFGHVLTAENRINRPACAAFFAHGDLATFHGKLNRLSARSLLEKCIIPTFCMGRIININKFDLCGQLVNHKT